MYTALFFLKRLINSSGACRITHLCTVHNRLSGSFCGEILLLKVLDLGLQRPTGPSSGAVACILLVSSRLWLKFVLLVWRCQCGQFDFEVLYIAPNMISKIRNKSNFVVLSVKNFPIYKNFNCLQMAMGQFFTIIYKFSKIT